MSSSTAERKPPFTVLERAALVGLAIAFIAPVPTLDGRFLLATELGMLAFLAAAHWRVSGWQKVLHLQLALAIPPLLAFFSPVGDYSLMVSGLIYVKLAVFASFVYVFVQRLQNSRNLLWVARWVVLPISLVLCGSALVDRYTLSPFFVRWHQLVTATSDSQMLRLLDLTDYDYVGSLQMSGFATRTSDIPPWSLLGIAAGYWLWQSGAMRSRTFALIGMVLLAAGFSMPKRSEVVLFAVAILTFAIAARRRVDRRCVPLVVAVVLVVGAAANVIGLAYEQALRSEGDEATAVLFVPSVYRLATKGLTDDRISNLPEELSWLVAHPRVLLLGSGWVLTAGYWTRPHNSYVGATVGGGLLTVIAVAAAFCSMLRRSAHERDQGPPGIMGVVLLVSMCVELGINGYATGRLEFPTSTLVFWMALTIVMYKVPATCPAAEQGWRTLPRQP